MSTYSVILKGGSQRIIDNVDFVDIDKGGVLVFTKKMEGRSFHEIIAAFNKDEWFSVTKVP